MSAPLDHKADTFGLPPSLQIPVAAADVGAIEEFVGKVVAAIPARTGRMNAAKVRTAVRPREPNRVPLWEHREAARFEATLYPEFQLWVHVDFDGYRRAWHTLEMPVLPPGAMLDHVANRRATRIRGYMHPFIRLVPVSRAVNTNAGHRSGAEGMERAYIQHIEYLPEAERLSTLERMRTRIVYADPMDLTKMLDVSPGTHTLDGVRDFQSLLYPA